MSVVFVLSVSFQILKWLEREFTDRKVRGSNPTSTSRLPLSRLGQPGSIPALVLPSSGMAARHRKGVTAESFFSPQGCNTNNVMSLRCINEFSLSYLGLIFGVLSCSNREMEVRVRLRPWLESRLDQGWIDGLSWIDKEKGIFKIPWKHHSKHTWTEEDAAIFKDWAVVTGRFRPGVDEPDWPMWKTRLRCALNKAPDIQEVKQHHDLHCDEPFKVYRFISKTESLWRANATRNASMIFDGISNVNRMNYSGISTLSPTTDTSLFSAVTGSKRTAVFLQRPMGMDSSPRTVTLVQRRTDGVVIRRLPCIQSRTLFPVNQQYGSTAAAAAQALKVASSSVASSASMESDDPVVCASWRYVAESSISAPTSILRRLGVLGSPELPARYVNPPYPPDLLEPEYHQLGIRIQHLGIRVKDTIITNPNGCCIYFGRFDEISAPAAPEPVEAQIPHHISEANKDYVDLLLDNMVRGVILSVVRGSIFAERMCKCAVFVYTPTPSGDHILLKKLGRRERELLFDYDEFVTDLQRFRAGEHPRPHFEVVLAFGQQLRPNLTSSSLLVWCRVASCRAWFQLHKDWSNLLSCDEGVVGDFGIHDLTHTSIPSEHAAKYSRNDAYFDNRSHVVVVNNGCGDMDSANKLHRINGFCQPDGAKLTLSDSLEHVMIGEEQVIEEAIEIPLDDHENDLIYDAATDELHQSIIANASRNPDVNRACTPALSAAAELFLDEDESAVLKSDFEQCD
ncbi:Interferon regulatory factor 4 [Clonorchis sinensis]|uniref:Interferon regulatory factor 4 n=1 Tax=Clonorchis sinensis TaxID=79923 RepID=A0A3R7FKC9_CLOSI|nr:Interferon regulatory factor 4 [Clonorchis sinensis]